MFSIVVALLGASFGSFAGVIITRWRAGISIVPPSFCVACKKNIKPWHNLPVLSWLWLGGKCAYCKSPFGLRLLILEILLTLCALAIYARVGFGFSFIDKFGFAFLLICIAYIDLDTFYLPLGLLLALLLWGILFSVIYYLKPVYFYPSMEPIDLLKIMVLEAKKTFSLDDRLLGALIGGLFLSLINILATLIFRRTGRIKNNQWAMGWGDPLLLMAIGLFVGLSHLVLVIFVASFLGSIVGIVHKLSAPMRAPEEVAAGALPYGPFLAIAAIYSYL